MASSIVASVVRRSDIVASLEPLLVQDSKSAYRRVEDLRAEYPDRGRVVWFEPPREAHERSLWRVEITECKTYRSKAENIDAFMVAQGAATQLLSDVLDFRNVGAEDIVRRSLTTEGIALRQPIGDSAFLWVGPRRFVGPVRLVQIGPAHRWFLDPLAVDEPIGCWDADDADVVHVDASGSSRSIAASTKTWRKVGLVDWNPDNLKVLTRALHDVRKLDPDFARSATLTAKAIDRLGGVLATAGGADRTLHEQRFRRIQEFLPDLERKGTLGVQISEQLLDLPSVRVALSQHHEAVAARAREEAIQLLEVEVAGRREDLEQLRAEGTAARSELEAVRSEIQKESEKLEAAARAFEKALAERVADVATNPQRFLADVTLLRAALGLHSPGPILSQSRGRRSKAASMVLTAGPQVRATLDVAFRAADLPISLGREMHASFLAGSVPALAGGRSNDALSTYARHVTGGEMVRVAVSPSTLSPWDLLNQVPMSGAPGQSLADYLADIAFSGDPTLLVFEQINASPIDSSFLPLLRTSDGNQGPIPPSVLVAVTLGQGPARLPLSESAWEYLILLTSIRSDTPRASACHPDRRYSPLPPSVMDGGSWRAHREEGREAQVEYCAKVLEAIPESLQLDPGVRDHCLRLFGALVVSGLEEPQALECALAGVVVPSLAHNGEELSKALAQQGYRFDRVAAALKTASALQ